MDLKAEKKYFKNIYGLRFIAALTVAISHFETIKSYRKLAFINNRFIQHSAQISVTFFFVLSGFLIMWWILEDTKGRTNQINLGVFYKNRFLRTWPLYYLVVTSSLLFSFLNGSLFNNPETFKRFSFYFIFMPNAADVLYKADIYLGPTWSLAVEEFFYFIFPLFLIKTQPKFIIKKTTYFLLTFLILSTVFNPIIFNKLYPGQFPLRNLIIVFFERYRMYSFLIGALVAVLIFRNESKVFCFNKKSLFLLQWAIIIITLSLFLFGITFSFFTHQFYSIIFAILIYLIAKGENSFLLIENEFMKLGGKISFSIYMIHMFIVMRLVTQGYELINMNNSFISILFSWIIFYICTIILSYFVYKYFENPIREIGKKI